MQPQEHLKDLTAIVSARIVGNAIHLDYALDDLRVTSDSVMVPSRRIPNREIAYRDNKGVQSAKFNLYARITTLIGRLARSFAGAISCDVPAALFQKTLEQSSIFQESVPVSPGLCRLDVVVNDQESNIGVLDIPLHVPRFEDGTLEASTVILADKIESVAAARIGRGPFVIGPCKVRLRVSHESNRRTGYVESAHPASGIFAGWL